MKEDKFYSEEEKDYYVAKAVRENNEILFNLIKEDIEHLITRRLIAFSERMESTSKQQESIDCCKG